MRNHRVDSEMVGDCKSGEGIKGLMVLGEVCGQLCEYDGESLIYAKRPNGGWSTNSDARVEPILNERGEERELGMKLGEYEFFLPVALAREVLEDWESYIGGPVSDAQERVRILAHYVENDALPAFRII